MTLLSFLFKNKKKISAVVALIIFSFGFSFSVLAIVDDPYFEYQDYLSKINYNDNRTSETGNGIVVAVIDGGVWQEHPDLSGNIWNNTSEIAHNGLDDDNNGYVDDFYGWNFIDNDSDMEAENEHATAVAGIIAAKQNFIGIAGIAPEAKIMSLIVCDSYGCETNKILEAISYAVDNGANIINLSLGSNGYMGFSHDYDDVLEYAFLNNVLVVVSAGNGDVESASQVGLNLSYIPVSPVCNDVDGHNIVLGVGASTNWSNYGDCVDVIAPGESVVSTTVPAFSDNYGYSYFDGTSFSAPMVTGAAALLWEDQPSLKNFEVMDYIISLADSDNLDIGNILGDKALPWASFDSVSETEVNAGDTITVTGENFRSGQQLRLIGDGVSSSILTSNIFYWGAEEMIVTIPASTKAGSYYLNFSTNTNEKSDSFTVLSSSTISGKSQTDSDSETSTLGGQYDPNKKDDSLISRLSGYILLQTEEHGEAWYINPADSTRYYMKDGATAYQMMHNFGLGITDADLAKIPSVEDTTAANLAGSVCASNSLANSVKGKILLQVQQHGEAWYIDPDTCNRIYMKDGDSAYTIMRFLSLGISDNDLSKVPSGEI